MVNVARSGKAFASTAAAVALAGAGAFGLAVAQAGAAQASTLARTGSSAAGSAPACASSQLSAKVSSDKGGGTAGNVHGTLFLKNTSSSACTLYGYPGVSFVTGDSGQQVGAPATRAGGTKKGTVLLPAGATALAELNQRAVGAFGKGCQETPTRGFRVYPPNQKAALFVADTGKGCANKADKVLSIGPVVPGAGASYAGSSPAEPTSAPGGSQQGGAGQNGTGQVSRIPQGGVATGGGSTAGVEDPWLFGVGGAAVLAAGGLVTLAVRRRHAGQR
jgi:hypothetical protein